MRGRTSHLSPKPFHLNVRLCGFESMTMYFNRIRLTLNSETVNALPFARTRVSHLIYSIHSRTFLLRTYRIRPIHLACELPPCQACGRARHVWAYRRTPRSRPQLCCCRVNDAGIHIRGSCSRENRVKPGGACTRSKRRLELPDDRLRAHREKPAGRERRLHCRGCVIGLQCDLTI